MAEKHYIYKQILYTDVCPQGRESWCVFNENGAGETMTEPCGFLHTVGETTISSEATPDLGEIISYREKESIFKENIIPRVPPQLPTHQAFLYDNEGQGLRDSGHGDIFRRNLAQIEKIALKELFIKSEPHIK